MPTSQLPARPAPLTRRALLAAFGVLAVGATGFLAGCSASAGPSGPAAQPADPIKGSDLARVAVALRAAPQLGQVAAGMTAFATRLHAVAGAASTNFTVSPLSLAVAFGMLRAGARGTTASQLDAVFGFPAGASPEGSPHEALNALTAALVSAAPQPATAGAPAPVVAIANGLFVAARFSPAVSAAFLNLLAQQYGAHPAAVDFTSPAAADTINRWVRWATRGQISRLFDQIDPNTLLVLADAVYLKATWASQFPPATTTGAFTTSTGARVPAALMHQSLDQVRYTRTAQWQRITLPYVGAQLSMRLVLPTRTAADTASLTAAVATAMDRADSDPVAWVDLTMPRWKTETDLDLLPVLAALGLTDLGDLSGIAAGVGVSQAVHRATITVDENGSQAAAVTGIAVASSGRVGSPAVMVVDRPFAWAVVHEPTRTPVFAGHVVNPS